MIYSARSGYGPLRAENFQLAFRRLRNPVRTSSVKSFGCPQAAKCPPEGVVDMPIEERELFVGCLLLARQIGQLLVRVFESERSDGPAVLGGQGLLSIADERPLAIRNFRIVVLTKLAD
ncbi:hypothetical protein B5K06_11460 [Rhizobium grahamii]|uniref:Uncharacterized protein n=1 Tax=Rhizobium grahamii TaxID=1120045 RepID=A0A370KRC5_9HYPH|nr:hypothetical protein B5K06_11460 [Rhizobium grahamii]